jgi:hypothetical protein
VAAALPSSNAAVFNLCPRFLLLVIAALALAELDSAIVGLPPPHRGVSFATLLLGWMILGAIFAAAARPRTRRDWVYLMAAGLILPLGNMILPWACGQTIRLLPHVYDAQVAQLDATLGVQPSFMMGEVFTRYPLLASPCAYIYGAVMFPAVLVGAIEAQYGRRMGIGALPTFLVIAGVGFLLYQLLPVVGPAPYFGRSFPFATDRSYLPAPRNAMPSLHTAWVLIAFLATRGMSLLTRIVTGGCSCRNNHCNTRVGRTLSDGPRCRLSLRSADSGAMCDRAARDGARTSRLVVDRIGAFADVGPRGAGGRYANGRARIGPGCHVGNCDDFVLVGAQPGACYWRA